MSLQRVIVRPIVSGETRERHEYAWLVGYDSTVRSNPAVDPNQRRMEMARYNASFSVVAEFDAVDDDAAERVLDDLRGRANEWPNEPASTLVFLRTRDPFLVRAETPEADPSS